MVDFLVEYLKSLSQRRVTANVLPGYLRSALPKSAPQNGESYEKIMEDIDRFILPGMTHWQHPGFHAYFSAASSFPATLSAMLSDMIGYPGFNWEYTPSGGEFETLMLNWYGNLIGLPRCFLHYGEESRGTGMLFRSTSECLFISLLTARRKFLNKLTNLNPALSKAALLCSLVAYCTKGAHSRLEKVALISLVNVRILDADKDEALRGELLDRAIQEDKRIGLIPFFVSIKIGCSLCGSSDPVKELGLVCEKHEVWLHVDASYAGNAAICPEYRYLIEGVEYASAFHSSPSHWMLTSLDCSVLFVQDRFRVADTVLVDRTKRGYSFEERDWGYPTQTECQGYKLLFVMRSYGIEGLQNHIRKHISLAKLFADYVKADVRFEFLKCHFGFVAFRLKGSEIINNFLKDSINDFGKLYVTPTRIKGKYAIRFFVCTEHACEEDIKFAWEEICRHAQKALNRSRSDLRHRSVSIDLFDEYYRYALP